MKKTLIPIVLASLSFAAVAAEQSFDFKDPKGVNNVIFKTDAPLESINGQASGVSGTVTFDPANPGSVKGKIIVEAASLNVPNATMKQHMHGAQWLDVAKNPQIIFEATKAENVKTEGTDTTADISGTMTLKGVTKPVTAKGVKLTYLKDKLKDRSPNMEGDLLVIRANFIVKRTDFGINAGSGEDKVSNDIQLTLSIAGFSRKAAP